MATPPRVGYGVDNPTRDPCAPRIRRAPAAGAGEGVDRLEVEPPLEVGLGDRLSDSLEGCYRGEVDQGPGKWGDGEAAVPHPLHGLSVVDADALGRPAAPGARDVGGDGQVG